MTVRWERFEGNTDAFAIRIAFLVDPGASSVDPTEGLSWGSFQLWVEGQNLCGHVDQGETLQSAHWYLLEFLEWVACNWNALLHEERLPNRNAADCAVTSLLATRNAPELAGETSVFSWEQEWHGWYRRHALRSARAGGLLPNVILRRLRDAIEISWDDEPLPGSPLGFRFSASKGVCLLAPEVVAGPLRDCTLAAANYLVQIFPESQRLRELRSALEGLDSPTQHGQRLEWLAGARATPLESMDLSSGSFVGESEDTWRRVLDAIRSTGGDEAAAAALEVDEVPLVVTGSSQAALLFGAVAPSISEADIGVLAKVLVDQYVPGDAEGQRLRDLVDTSPLDAGRPAWEQGYDLAETLHDHLLSQGDWVDGDWVDIAMLVESLGITLSDVELSDNNIRGCGVVGPRHRPTVLVNRSHRHFTGEAAKRFTIAHELCHILYDRAFGQRLAIASGPWAPRALERRANAFAAMFLMPPNLVEKAVADLPDPITQVRDVQVVSDRLHVSRSAAAGHLYNLTLMSESDRDEVLRTLGPDRGEEQSANG